MYLKLFFLLFVSIPFIYCKKDALSLHCFFSKYILKFFELNEKLFILNRISNAKSDYDIDDLKYYGTNLQSQGDIIMAMLDELREKKYNELPDDLMMVNLYLNNVTGNINLYTVDKSNEGRELVTDALRLRLGFKTYYKMITNKLLNFTKSLHCKYGLWFDKVDPKFKRLKINIDKKSQVNYDASRMREFLENVKNNSRDVFNHTFMRNKYTDYHPKNLLLYNLMEPYSKYSKRSIRNDGLNIMRFVKVHSIANYESKHETKIINLYERVLLTFNVQHIKSYQQQVLAATMYPVFMCISKYINMFNKFYSTGYTIFCYPKDIIDIGSSLVTITQTLRDINLYPYEINQYLSQLICDLGIIVIYPSSKMWPSSFNYKNKVITILNKLSKPMLTNRILFNIKDYTLNDSGAHSCLVLIDEIKIEIKSITNYLKKLKRKRYLFLVTQEIINHNDMFKNIPIDVFNVQVNGTIYFSEHTSKLKNNISNRLSKFFNQTEDYNNKERNKNNKNIQNVLESNENINITAEESHNYNEITENHETINSQNNYLQNVHLDNNEIAKNNEIEEINKNNTNIQNVLESNENINITAEESHNYNEITENHETINSQNNYLQNVHLDNNEIAKNNENEEINKNNTNIQNVLESNENINITAEESHNYNEITENHETINSQNNYLQNVHLDNNEIAKNNKIEQLNKNNTNIQNVLESNENINITAEESHNYNEITENHETINSQNNYLQNVHLDNNEIAKNDEIEEINKNNTNIQNVLESNENINITAEESHNYNEITEKHEKINSQNNYLQNVHLDNNEIAKNDEIEQLNKNNTTIQNVLESNENVNITAEESHNYNEITEKHEKINSQNNYLSLSGESEKYSPIYSVDHAEKTHLNNTINNLPNSKYNYLLLANNSKSDLNIFKEKYDKIVVELNNIYQQLNNIKSSDNNSIVKPSSILNYTHKCTPNYLYDIYNENNVEDDESGQNYFKNQLQVDDNFSQKHQLGYYETSNNSADIGKDNITNINNSMENNSVLFSPQRSENNYINENGEKKAEQFYHTNLSFAENSPSNNLQINSHKQQNVDGNESSNNSSKKILDYIIENGDKNIVETNFITNQLNINENFNNYSSIENKISFDVVSKFENNYIDKNNRLIINNDHITSNNPNKSINGNHSEKDKLTLVDKNIVFIQKSDETQEAGIMSHNRVDQINSPNDKINIHSKYFHKNNFEIKGNYLKKGPADDYYGNATLMHCFFSKYTLRYLELNEKYINSICDRNTSDTVTEDTLNFYISNLLFQSENIMAMLDELRNKQKNHFVHDLMSVNLYLNNITGNLSTNFQKNVDLQNENNNIEIRRQILQENLNILKSYILKYLDTNCHVVLSNQIDIHFKDLNQIVTIPVHDKVDSHTEKILADIQLLQYYGHAVFKTIVNKNDYKDFHPKNMLFYYLMTGNAKPDEITENNSIEHIARFDDGLSAIREVILKSSHDSILKHTVVDVFYCVSLNFNADYVKAFQQIVLSATIHPIFKAISQYIIGFKQIYFIAKVSDKYATIITDIGNSLLKSIRQFFNLNLFSEEINTYLKGVLNKLEFIVNYKTKKLIKLRAPNIVSELLSLCSKPMELNWLVFIIEDNFKNTMNEDKLDLLTNDLRTITNKIYMYVKSLSIRRHIFNIVKRSISHDDMFKMKPIDILQICSRDA
ncbi:protein PF3D7_1417600-like [Daktulosphaira vitifoliae]|uniref:protein PF3D7_1417600-like n=1 Tax=Daktulosphaira vitifoliae TaxID=58002 RepID=UPI0021AA3400|nr:protein PF3D7_1417600-like [Daktulosphaira vitifoliae]